MRRPVVLTLPAPGPGENEDAVVTDDRVGVVVDGAGLPADLRQGCRHSVAWFARSVAHTFHNLLAEHTCSMREALAVTITRVRDSHAMTCGLTGGSPSATVAAWRLAEDQLEYLVLCDASIVLLDRHHGATHVVDRRIDDLVTDDGPADVPVTADQVRAARRSAVEEARNKPGGFWCVHTDPSAAAQAIHGAVPLRHLAGVVACSDGGARAFELLDTHTLEQFADLALRGEHDALAGAIRAAEKHQAASIRASGAKIHDDISIAALPLLHT